MKYYLIGLSLVLGIMFSSICNGADYKQAYIDMYGNGKPLAVYIGAEWCGPCKMMRAGPLARIKSTTLFSTFNYMELDVDNEEHKSIIKTLKEHFKLTGNKIPLMIFIQRNGQITKVEGYQEYSTLESTMNKESTFYGRPRVSQP